MGEDCLTLDVYRPIQASYYPTKYPIMVWIHGGGYESGNSGMYDGGRIVQKDIVNNNLPYGNFEYTFFYTNFLYTKYFTPIFFAPNFFDQIFYTRIFFTPIFQN